MSLRIAFDCDGVIADLDAALAEIAIRLFGEAPLLQDDVAGPKSGASSEAHARQERRATVESRATPGSPSKPERRATAESRATPGPPPKPDHRATAESRPAEESRATPDRDEGPSAEEEQVEPPRYRAFTRGQQHDLWEAVRNTENFWESLDETEPGIIARLAQVARERRWEVIFITQRPSSAGDTTQLQTQRWLVKHGYDFPNVYVIKGTRGKVAEALSLDIVVDDRPENCLDVKIESRARAILVWNDDLGALPPNAKRLGIEAVAGPGACLDLLTVAPGGTSGLIGKIRKLFGG